MEQALQLILEYRYWILFPLACFEGPITGFIVGTLVALGYFNPLLVFIILVLGDVIPDVIYYMIGRYGEQNSLITKYMSKIGITSEHMGVLHTMWHKHTGKSMVFSKLAYGLSTPFLISAGAVNLNLKRFIKYSLPISVAQYAILMGLGYFFGAAYYSTITKSVDGIGIIIAAVVVVGVLYYLFTRFMRQKFLKTENEILKGDVREEGKV